MDIAYPPPLLGPKNIVNISTAWIVSYYKHHDKTDSGNAMSKRLVDAKWQNDIVEDDDDEDDEDEDEDDEDDNFSAAGSEERPLAQPPQQHAPWDLDLNLHNIVIIIVVGMVNTRDKVKFFQEDIHKS